MPARLSAARAFFRQLTDDVVREGSFRSITELVTAINGHLAHHNLKPPPYRWRADGTVILEKRTGIPGRRRGIFVFLEPQLGANPQQILKKVSR